jgi:signal transduction histidine kinase
VIAVILPLNWYWGQRMTRPLVDLARRMGNVARGGQDDGPREIYPYRDELGQLFAAYDTMQGEMQAKARMEREILQSERLAAIGRLAAGIAHEVNNPLGGMLMALDTLRERGDATPQVLKTMGLVERGLRQIQETVAALLVQARDQSRPLSAHDLEDVHTLILPQVVKKSQKLDWQVSWSAATNLPAAACRQIMINLLLNAVQATNEGGRIVMLVEAVEGADGAASEFRLAVINEADAIAPERMEHLFEPFVTHRDGGNGLGLWVTYQIVKQMGGNISAACANGEVRFEVNLPTGEQ